MSFKVLTADGSAKQNVVALTLPPLRVRREAIPALAAFFLQHFAAETKNPSRASPHLPLPHQHRSPSFRDTEDEGLIGQIAAHDAEAFTTLYQR